MGESMGGLVARYGLARLVRNGYNPQTRLLVLHDSPQRGANNPMGLQALTRQADFPLALLPGNGQGNNGNGVVRTSDLSDKLKEGLAVLEAPATKQLSLKSVTGVEYDYQNNTFIDGPYKDMVDFSVTGGPPASFPVIVATSDGSQCGHPQNTPAYQELTRDNRDWLFGPAGLVRLGIQSEGIANALPAYGTQNTIAHLRVWFTIHVLWFYKNITLLNRNYTSPPNTLPYETLPGGTTNLSEQQDLTDNHGNGFLGLWRLAGHTTLYNGDLCFVPTYSALDVPVETSATAYATYINDISSSSRPPRVARYIAQENVNNTGTQFNQAHIRFTARNSEWIFNEMQRPFNGNTNTRGCTTECSEGLTISRSLAPGQRLCPGGSVTFSVSGVPAGTGVNWSTSTPYLFTTTTGTGLTFTTTAKAGSSGAGYVMATLANACGSAVGQNVQIGGGPEPTGRYTSMNNLSRPLATVNTVQPGEVRITMDGIENFTFTSDQPSVVPVYGGRQQAAFSLSAGQGVHITANAGGACGIFGNFTFTTNTWYTYGFAPNPVGTLLTVTATANGQPAGVADPAAPTFDADLYDGFGKKVKTKKSELGKSVLDVRDLPEGLYNLRVGQGKNALSEHIQVTH